MNKKIVLLLFIMFSFILFITGCKDPSKEEYTIEDIDRVFTPNGLFPDEKYWGKGYIRKVINFIINLAQEEGIKEVISSTDILNYGLGIIYAEGLGVEEDIKKGVGYLQKVKDDRRAKEALLRYKKNIFGKWVRR